jgi:Na+/H+ antiporter NhaD/arsenite permease-like protein
MADGTGRFVGTLKNIPNSVDGIIQSLSGLGNAVKSLGKMIWHYITFSIGVQMVMKLKQGFTELIESFTVQTSGTGWYTHDISDLPWPKRKGRSA